MLEIGSLRLECGLMLAPMAGFSDHAMRVICHKHGAEYSVSEMVSATAVRYGDKKTEALSKIGENEGEVAVQIFGSDPDTMAYATEKLSTGLAGRIPAAIDINMGCPVRKIYSNGEGSALMRSPGLISEIVGACVGATSLPVTVKIRTGIDSENINAVECALAAESGGASLITVHGRTREMMYSGEVDLETIARVKGAVRIPVIANGDVKCLADAKRMLSLTGADGIMIGRGAIGNPFLFEEIRAGILGISYTPPTLSERIETALCQLSLAIEEKGETRAVLEARGSIALYLHGFRGSARLRAEINKATTYSEVFRAMMTVSDE